MYYEKTPNTLSVEAHLEDPSSTSSTSIDSTSKEMQMEYDYLLDSLNKVFSEIPVDVHHDPICAERGRTGPH